MAASGVTAKVLEHSRFFNQLVELIPARFYHTEEEAPVNLKFMKKGAREKEKETRKQQAKVAKRARLNPDTAQTALDVQQSVSSPVPSAAKVSLVGSAEQDQQPKPGQESARAGLALQLGTDSGAAPSMEVLKERLQKRLQVLREKRQVEERKQRAQKAADWRAKSIGQSKGQSKGQVGGAAKSYKRTADMMDGTNKAAAGPGSTAKLSFGKLEFGEESAGQGFKKQRKLSKAELLKDAEAKLAEQMKLATSKEGQVKLYKDAWGSALARAGGEKILDDPKLLRKSMKKEEKQKSKKAATWQDRQRHQRQDGKDRQKRRRENLQARVQAKQQSKVAKREKKLMRPGFEGRRATFINDK